VKDLLFEIPLTDGLPNFDALASTSTPGYVRRPLIGRKATLEEHVAVLRSEFAGLPQLLYFHAALVVMIRRHIDQDRAYEVFCLIWKKHRDTLLSGLSSRWLISACDTIMEHSKDLGEQALACTASTLLNTIKLYETERLVCGTRELKLPSSHSPEPLFDGLTSFSIGKGEMIQSLRQRSELICRANMALSSAAILLEVFRRIDASDNIYSRLAAVHIREETRWDFSHRKAQFTKTASDEGSTVQKPSASAVKLRVRLEGDHSSYHCGSAAVMDYLKFAIFQNAELVDPTAPFDVLVVNGEGSMHHGWANFRRKMELLREAQAQGKRTYLINSLWQENPSDYDDVLHALDGISVRGPKSANDLKSRHGVVSHQCLDLCYFAPLENVAQDRNFKGATVITDVYSNSLGGFVWPSEEHLTSMPRLDLRSTNWAQFISNLRSASVLVTGRHHGMYAACKARVPFVLFEGNSHKMDDLLSAYQNIDVPRCSKFGDIRLAAKTALEQKKEFNGLFDWMETQTPWLPRF
jgi:hypothetical protein